MGRKKIYRIGQGSTGSLVNLTNTLPVNPRHVLKQIVSNAHIISVTQVQIGI